MSMIETHLSDNAIGSTEPMVSAPQNVSRAGRLLIVAIEISLVVVLAFLVIRLVYGMATPQSDFSNEFVAAGAPIDTQGEATYQTVVSFDPFYRQLSAESSPAQVAPETKLKITVAGLRVGPNGSGAAIIEAQGTGQKLVLVGGEISPGVRLARLFPDRIEITRRGLRETVYMTKPDATTGISADIDDRVPEPEQTSRSGLAELLVTLTLEPVRSGGRLTGFRVMEGSDANSLAQARLEVEDVILSVNGSPLTSFERVEELGEELSGADVLTLEIERRGERLIISL